jgi:hypothetical protein
MVIRATPLGQILGNGSGRPPPFYPRRWLVKPSPWPLEVIRPPPKSKIGVAETPLKSLGGGSATPIWHGGWLNHPYSPWGWFSHPHKARERERERERESGRLRVWPLGVAEPTHGPKMGGRATPKAFGVSFGHPHFVLWGWLNHPHGLKPP